MRTDLEYPGFITMGRMSDGQVQPASVLRIVHPEAGAVSAMPVYLEEDEAESPDDDLLSLRTRNSSDLEAWPIRDVYEACALAEILREAMGRPFCYLWDYRNIVDCDRVWHGDLLRAEAEANEDPCTIEERHVADLRDKAWGSEYQVENEIEVNVRRHGVLAGRLALFMMVLREGNVMTERLVARYRGTPRQLAPEEIDEVLRACYLDEGVELDEVDGPHVVDANGLMLAWQRSMQVGPRAL